MARMACVDLPALPLQLLLRSHPDWKRQPAAVVDCDKPQGRILWINEHARACRIISGMRYAAALSLAGNLCADVVAPEETERAVAGISRRLRRFTPHVEESDAEPGIMWLDATGLEHLYGSIRNWARSIHEDLKRAGWQATIVVGFTRFGTYALARSKQGALVLNTTRDESSAARKTPLDRIGIQPSVRDALTKLGIADVGAFSDLPAEGIGKRFGPETAQLHQLASGDLGIPLQPRFPEQPAFAHQILDHPVTSTVRLLAWIERMLGPLIEIVAGRAQSLTGIKIGFRFERLGEHFENIRPAAPTLDRKQLLELIQLRLEACKLPDRVEEVLIVADGGALDSRQLKMFANNRRNYDAANRALARIRADLGEGAVVRAELREGHLPEACFTWKPVDSLQEARPRDVENFHMVRRINARPVPLPPRPRREPDGWMLRGLEHGPIVRVFGPYIVSGGWWNRSVHREYHFAETQKGALLWVYYDRNRRRWFLQGRVE